MAAEEPLPEGRQGGEGAKAAAESWIGGWPGKKRRRWGDRGVEGKGACEREQYHDVLLILLLLLLLIIFNTSGLVASSPVLLLVYTYPPFNHLITRIWKMGSHLILTTRPISSQPAHPTFSSLAVGPPSPSSAQLWLHPITQLIPAYPPDLRVLPSSHSGGLEAPRLPYFPFRLPRHPEVCLVQKWSSIHRLRRVAVPCKVSLVGLAHANGAAQRDIALYDKFVEFAVEEVGKHAQLVPFPFLDEFKTMPAKDGKMTLNNIALQSTHIRLFRIASLNGGDSMQVLNLAVLPRPEYDLPIFCADFFSTSTKHVIVLDLNPLYDAEKNILYKEKYYPQLMPLVNKYVELLPWGEKLTTESLQFFSPLLIWTKLDSKHDVQEKVYLAFQDYLMAWLELMDRAEPSTDPMQISKNQEAQHRYLLWRATKDPGRHVLLKLFGAEQCERYISEFLFNGLNSMGNKGFLDFFPEYRNADGTINRQQSIIGKSCSTRPWDKYGNFIRI